MQRLGGARRVRLQPRSFGVSPHAWASVLSPERAFDLSGTSNSHPVSNSEVVESAYAPPLVVFAADGAWSIYGVSCDRRVAASSAHVWASRVRFAERATRSPSMMDMGLAMAIAMFAMMALMMGGIVWGAVARTSRSPSPSPYPS